MNHTGMTITGKDRAVSKPFGARSIVGSSGIWCTVLLLFISGVLFAPTMVVAAPACSQSIIGYSPSHQLAVEDFWRETLIFEVEVTEGNFVPGAVSSDPAQFVLETVQGAPGVADGIQTHKAAIFNVSLINPTTLRYWAKQSTLLAFVAAVANDTLTFTYTNGKITTTSATVSTGSRKLTGLTTQGSAEFAVIGGGSAGGGLDERNVRLTGIQLRVRLQFNAFPSINNAALIFSSNNAALNAAAASGQWQMSIEAGATLPSTIAIVTLPALPNFNVSTPAWLFVRVNESATKVTLMGLSPGSANLTIAAVDNAPIAYCIISNATITEAEFRSAGTAGVLRNISLSPPDLDAFVTSPRSTVDPLILRSITQPSDSGLLISVDNVTAEIITLRVTAALGSIYDTDTAFPLTIVLHPLLLVSKEATCGRTFIDVVPSPGAVVGLNNTRSVTELQINDATLTLDFSVAFDRFTATPTFTATSSLWPPTATDSGAEYFGYDRTMVSRSFAYTTDLNRRQLRIQFPPIWRYNIPTDSVETIHIYIPGSAMLSGVAPTMSGAVFNITGVEPTFNISFGDDITQGSVAVKTLWSQGANMSLNLRGDTWDVDGKALWNTNHPKVDGSITVGEELYAMKQTIDRLGGLEFAVDYANVNISLRVARLPLFPLPGLSLPFDERVRVSKLSQLILGRPTVAQGTFIATQISPIDIVVTFGGVATLGRTIPEKEFRSGFWFTIELSNQVFRINSTQWIPQLFPAVSSLTPFLHLCTAVREPLWIYNMSCPPLPTFDIDSDELINIEVPREFYYEVLPLQLGVAAIGITAAPSPTCVWDSAFDYTEGDIRSSPDGFLIVIRASSPFVEFPNTLNLTGVVTSRHQEEHPLRIEIQPRLEPLLLHLKVLFDPSYQINTNDLVTVSLNRFFFIALERCNPLNFTIGVLPGSGYGVNMSDGVAAQTVRERNFTFEIVLVGERVEKPSFDLTTTVSYLPDNSDTRTIGPVGTGTDATVLDATRATYPVFGWVEARQLLQYKATAVAITNWTSLTANSTTFAVTIQRLPGLKILQPENVTFRIPGSAVASGVQPDLSGTSLVIYPSQSRVSYNFSVWLDEANVTRGTGAPLRIQLLDDYWNSTTAPELIRTGLTRTGRHGSPLISPSSGSVQAIFSSVSFSFPAPDVMQIIMQGDETYDARADEEITLYFTGAMTVSGTPPLLPNLTFFVRAGAPKMLATGSALDAGSRQYILGGLDLELYLENDLFKPNILLPSDICPFADCTIALSQSRRRLSVNFEAQLEAVLISDVTFTVSVNPVAILSGTPVNNITLNIAHEPGLATLGFQDLPSVVTEDSIVQGNLPALLLNVIGDRFKPDIDRLSRALTEGTRCAPISDAFGFCSQARAIFTTIKYRFFDGSQAATLSLQANSDYDIALPEVINISIGSYGMESGLAPTGFTVLTVQPVRGTFFFSATQGSVPSAALQLNNDIDVVFTIALLNERFVADPLQLILEASTSSRPANSDAGFNLYRSTMFRLVDLSANARVLKFALRRTPGYAAADDEVITFKVPAGAVVGTTNPVKRFDATSTFMIVRSGGVVTLLSPSVITADSVRTRGINVSFSTTDVLDGQSITRANARVALIGTTPPSIEPHGFQALAEVFAVQTLIVESSRIDIIFSPAAAYSLVNDEFLTFRLNDNSWGASDRPMYPSFFTIRVRAKTSSADTMGQVLLYMPTPVDEAALRQKLANFIGVSSDRVLIVTSEAYDAGGRYQRVGVDVLDAASADSSSTARTSSEAVSFLMQSDGRLLAAQLNISALCRASAPIPDAELELRLGLRQEVVLTREEANLIWVWVSLGVLGAAAIVAFAVYHYHLKGRMIAASAKGGRNVPLLRLRNKRIATATGGNHDDGDDDSAAAYDDVADYTKRIIIGEGSSGGSNKSPSDAFHWTPERDAARISPSPQSSHRSGSADDRDFFLSGGPSAAANRSGALRTPSWRQTTKSTTGGPPPPLQRSARRAPPATADAALDELLESTGGRAPWATPPASASASKKSAAQDGPTPQDLQRFLLDRMGARNDADDIAASRTMHASAKKTPATATAAARGGAAKVRPFADDDEKVAGPSLAGSRARAVKIDLDEFVDSRQPKGFLHPTVEPLTLPPLERLPMPTSPIGIYPPGTPASAKFRTRHLDTRKL